MDDIREGAYAANTLNHLFVMAEKQIGADRDGVSLALSLKISTALYLLIYMVKISALLY